MALTINLTLPTFGTTPGKIPAIGSSLGSSKIVFTDSQGKLNTSGTVTAAEVEFLTGTSGTIQTQITSKLSKTLNLADLTNPQGARINLGITEGSYMPTLTNTANIDASTAYVTNYLRVGSAVHVWGRVDIDATTTITNTQMGMSLPVASNFADIQDLGGTAIVISNVAPSNVFALYADATNDRVFFQGRPTNTGLIAYSFHFSYKIIP